MNQFKVSFLVIIVLFFSSQTIAQLGLRVKNNINSFPTWNKIIQESLTNENDVLTSNFELGLDYRFKMKNIRIDILNEIAYGFRKGNNLTNLSSMQFSYFAFNMNTQIYAFNLQREDGIDKTSQQRRVFDNLFFTISPGIAYNYINDIQLRIWPINFPPAETDGSTNLHQFQFHLRFGF
ncbi:MAG: hypothetical protein AAGA77_09155 [Bacteroidota bacterium]